MQKALSHMEKMVKHGNEAAGTQLGDRLKKLEYAIRTSITVREDQEEDADPSHLEEAERCGIITDALMTKGDLLNAVQTAARATAVKSGCTDDSA